MLLPSVLFHVVVATMRCDMTAAVAAWYEPLVALVAGVGTLVVNDKYDCVAIQVRPWSALQFCPVCVCVCVYVCACVCVSCRLTLL
jgi:hypothetical protein